MSGFSNGKLVLDSTLTVTTSGENNDVPAMGSLMYISPANDNDSITGIDPGDVSDGALILMPNVDTTKTYIIKNNSSSSLAQNRILTYNAANLNVPPAHTAVAGYDTTNQMWHILKFPDTRTFTNNPSRTIQTVAASANGFQLSTISNAEVSYSCTIVTTASIGGNASGTIVLEIAATNSSTAADWQEIARMTNGQALTLAITLQSVQTISSTLTGIVPRGYYVRLRSINNNGTPSYSYNSGQEVLA